MATPTRTRKITLEPVQPLTVEPRHDTLALHPLAGSQPHVGLRRRYLAENWQPKGLERYQYQKGLLDQMNVLGGINDQDLPSQQRYTPISTCVESLECGCEGPYGEQERHRR